MASKQLTVVDIFNSLTPAEKRKALAVLRQGEQTACDRLDCKLKPARILSQWFKPPQVTYICERCGRTVTV